MFITAVAYYSHSPGFLHPYRNATWHQLQTMNNLKIYDYQVLVKAIPQPVPIQIYVRYLQQGTKHNNNITEQRIINRQSWLTRIARTKWPTNSRPTKTQ